MIETLTLNSRSEVVKLAQILKTKLGERTVFLFIGEVGSGKTTTVGELCKILGMQEVASPSFAIHHRYENSKGESLDHVDLYRLRSEEDLESTGFWDLFSQEKSWVIVEWADQLASDVWPLNWDRYEVRFEKISPEQRKIQIQKLD